MKKEFIWFDLGYTLLYLEREEAYRQALLDAGIEKSLTDIEYAFHFTDKLFMREFPGCFGGDPGTYILWFLGRLNYFLNIRVNTLDVYNSWMKIRSLQPRQWSMYGFVPSTLDRLASLGYRLGIISNWDTGARGLLDDFGLSGKFETIVISSEEGCLKPSPEIFLNAFSRAGTDASSSLYVGDNYYDDAVGSKRVGMDFLIINRFGRFGVEELSDCEIISDITFVEGFLEGGG